MNSLPTAFPDLSGLVRLFYTFQQELATFVPVAADELPEVPRRLLAHDEHMTIVLESIHGSAVDVHVLASHITDGMYCRKIYLTRQADDAPVLFGIIRMNLDLLDVQVRREILSQKVPLGRVLIRHNVLRKVELVQLFRVSPQGELARLLDCEGTVYGRTAWIHLNDQPAVELLEIIPAEVRPVAPGASAQRQRGKGPASPDFATLRERLRDWSDDDSAMRAVGICLGLIESGEPDVRQRNPVFRSTHPLGNFLGSAVQGLVALGAVEKQTLPNGEARFRWNAAYGGEDSHSPPRREARAGSE